MIAATEQTPTRVTRPRQSARGEIVAAIGPTRSPHVLRMAAQIAARGKRSLAVVSVVEPPGVFAFDTEHLELNPWKFESLREERREILNAELEALHREHVALPNPSVGIFVGDPPSTIAEVARAGHAAVIVMGIGPHAIRHRLFSAETTLATARHAWCPVLAVHHGASEIPTNIVVAVDFSPESIHAACEAVQLLGDDVHLHLVHVWSRITTPYRVSAFEELDAEYERGLPERFLRMRAALECAHSVRVSTHVREGDAATELLGVAREMGAGLLVAGMRGLDALERLFVGSVSTALLRSAECAVLLVPGPGVVERGELMRIMTGSSMDSEPAHWAEELDGFARRNQSRRAALEIDDHAIGAQRQLSGYVLSAATYDQRDGRVALMFGGGGSAAAHVTHTVGGVQSISIAGSAERDEALCIESDGGRAILTFLDK